MDLRLIEEDADALDRPVRLVQDVDDDLPLRALEPFPFPFPLECGAEGAWFFAGLCALGDLPFCAQRVPLAEDLEAPLRAPEERGSAGRRARREPLAD
jgi:hypothetical protein